MARRELLQRLRKAAPGRLYSGVNSAPAEPLMRRPAAGRNGIQRPADRRLVGRLRQAGLAEIAVGAGVTTRSTVDRRIERVEAGALREAGRLGQAGEAA